MQAHKHTQLEIPKSYLGTAMCLMYLQLNYIHTRKSKRWFMQYTTKLVVWRTTGSGETVVMSGLCCYLRAHYRLVYLPSLVTLVAFKGYIVLHVMHNWIISTWPIIERGHLNVYVGCISRPSGAPCDAWPNQKYTTNKYQILQPSMPSHSIIPRGPP